MTHFIILISALMFWSGCSSVSNRTKFDNLLAENRCDEASLNVPGFQEKTIENVKNLGSKSASYILTGSAYGVDLVYFIAGGIILPTIVCSPVLILDAPLGFGGDAKATGACFDKAYLVTQKEDNLASRINLGDEAFKKTAHWRCPDFTFAVSDVSKIADCHERAGNYEKAITQLKNLVSPESFGGCINSEEERKVIDRLIFLRKLYNKK